MSVPEQFDVAIDGREYIVDTSRMSDYWSRTVPLLRQQSDSSNEPSEASLNPEGAWLRGQGTWHRGAGQSDQDGPDAIEGRFFESLNIDPWTKGELRQGHGIDEVATPDGAATSSKLLFGGDNTLFGGGGDDNLSATGGNNYLDGEEGNNTLYADGGGNTLFANMVAAYAALSDGMKAMLEGLKAVNDSNALYAGGRGAGTAAGNFPAPSALRVSMKRTTAPCRRSNRKSPAAGRSRSFRIRTRARPRSRRSSSCTAAPCSSPGL